MEPDINQTVPYLELRQHVDMITNQKVKSDYWVKVVCTEQLDCTYWYSGKLELTSVRLYHL